MCSSVGWRSIAGDVHKNANVFMFNHHHHSRTHKYTPEYFGMANGIAGWDSEKTDGMGECCLFFVCFLSNTVLASSVNEIPILHWEDLFGWVVIRAVVIEMSSGGSKRTD